MNATKRGPGRPRSVSVEGQPPSEGNPAIQTRLPRAVYAWVLEQAQSKGCTPSEWVRHLVETVKLESDGQR